MKRVLVTLAILLFCGVAFSQNRWINRDFKYTHSGMQDENYPCPSINPACLHSRWDFETAVAGTYTSDTGGFVMTVNGAPVRVDDGTWPHADGIAGVQGEAWSFGAADSLSRADDGSFDMDLGNNPDGDFSIQLVITPATIVGNVAVASNSDLVNTTGWHIARLGAVINITIGNGAGWTTASSPAGALAAHRPAFVTFTYRRVGGAANNEGRVYVDNLATGVANNLGLVADSAEGLAIAMHPSGVSHFIGTIHDLKIYKGLVISEAQHDAMYDQWRGAASTFARNVVTTTVSASPPAIPFAPPASGTEPFLIDNPANSFYIGSPAAGSGGLYGPCGMTSKWWRGSVETCAVGNHPDGWVINENNGGGAATVAVDCDPTTSAHGGMSLLFDADNGGLPQDSRAYGACQVNWINQDVTLAAWGITTTGVGSCAVRLFEYSDAACATFVAANTLWGNADPGATWTQLKGTMAAGAWNVATSSWKPFLMCLATGAAYTVNFDAFMALQEPATFASDAICTTDADADAVCTDTVHSILSPISANGQMSIKGTFRTPYAGTDITAGTPLFADGVLSAANTMHISLEPTTDEPVWVVFDNAAASRSNSPNVLNWTADADHEVVVRTGGNDNLGLYWNAVWDNVLVGPGAGVRNAAQATSYISGDDTDPGDVWTRNLQFYRRMLETIP